MGNWESIFKKKGAVFLEPQEDMSKVIRLLKKNRLKTVLDLGCGSGRHTVMLTKEGFNVFASDISKEGLSLTRKMLNESKLKAKTIESSCYERFPFTDNFFDAVISIQVIHHNYRKDIQYCISEIERVLKPNGIIFVTVKASKEFPGGATKIKLLASRTYIPINGREAGVVHFRYTKKLMQQDFKNFKIIDFHMDKGKHYCLLGRLKLQ